mgnify:FL=1|tara:strand:+ start:5291 stop:5932 length:642 start_codon:yes stop_codon:yes gene_type:complete
MSFTKETVFGFPVLKTSIDPKSYNKKKVISTIEKNYKIDKNRNNWDSRSNLHHAHNDFNNSRFNKINFDELFEVYKKALSEMFTSFSYTEETKINFGIINYSCLGKTQYMDTHLHSENDFNAIHYIQFDEKNHTGTQLESSQAHSKFAHNLRPHLVKKLDNTKSENSWMYDDWTFNTKEDDLIVMPCFVRHRIPMQKFNKKHRITIALDINLE